MAGSDMKRGEFRTDRRSVYSDDGQELFITCPPEHISEELDSMLHWLNRTGSTMYPVIAGALMFHEFESIHPFEDGNGICGRSLFHLYLQQNGLPNSRLCYIEQQMVSDPERYYDILARTDHTGDYAGLIHHFTTSVLRSYESACGRLRSKDILSRDLDELSRRLILKSKAYREYFTLREARDWTSESDYVLRKRLSDLVEIGVLWAEGSTKSKRYIFADPIRSILDNPSERMRVLRSTLRGDEFR
jgi:Fic family protein